MPENLTRKKSPMITTTVNNKIKDTAGKQIIVKNQSSDLNPRDGIS
jgi:hypothetical protein